MTHTNYAFSVPPGSVIPRYSQQYSHFGRCRRRPRTIYDVNSIWRTSMTMAAPDAVEVQTVVYGEALMDLHERPDGKWDAYPGGAPNNLACALGKLGHRTAYVASIGDDEYGTALMAELNKSGVNTECIQMFPHAQNPTRGVYVKYTEDGQPEFAGYTSRGSLCADAQEMNRDDINININSNIFLREFVNAQVLAIGTLPLASPGSRRTQESLVRQARELGLRVVVDLNWRNVFWGDSPAGLNAARNTIMEFVKKNASYVKASVEDLKFLVEDFTGDAGDAGEESASDTLLDAFGTDVEGLIITDGEKGCKYIFRNGNNNNNNNVRTSGNVRAFAVRDEDVVDCVGAGDAFLGGFIAETFKRGGLHTLKSDDEARKICEFAAAVAQFVVREKGAVGPQPSRAAVEHFLDTDFNKTSPGADASAR